MSQRYLRRDLIENLSRYVQPELRRLRARRDPALPGYRSRKTIALEVVAATINFLKAEGAALDEMRELLGARSDDD